MEKKMENTTETLINAQRKQETVAAINYLETLERGEQEKLLMFIRGIQVAKDLAAQGQPQE